MSYFDQNNFIEGAGHNDVLSTLIEEGFIGAYCIVLDISTICSYYRA